MRASGLASLLVAVAVAALAACQNDSAAGGGSPPRRSQPSEPDSVPPTGAPLAGDSWSIHGTVHSGAAIEVADVLGDLMSYAGKPLRVAGPVHEIDPAKGTLRLGDAGANLFVRMRDSAIAASRDAVGRRAVVEGELTVATPAAGGEAGPVGELVADGVAIAKPDQR